jgi:hypothetical protein
MQGWLVSTFDLRQRRASALLTRVAAQCSLIIAAGGGADPRGLRRRDAAALACGDGGARRAARHPQRPAARGKLAVHEEFPDATAEAVEAFLGDEPWNAASR